MSEPIATPVNALNRPFWDAAANARLLLPWCPFTQRFFWPPSPLSPYSGAEPEWGDAPATGVLRAIAVYRRAFQKAFAPVMPYGVGLVELDAGPRLQAHLAAPDAADAPKPGDRVILAFHAILPHGPKVPHIVGEKQS